MERQAGGGKDEVSGSVIWGSGEKDKIRRNE